MSRVRGVVLFALGYAVMLVALGELAGDGPRPGPLVDDGPRAPLTDSEFDALEVKLDELERQVLELQAREYALLELRNHVLNNFTTLALAAEVLPEDTQQRDALVRALELAEAADR